MQRPRHQETEMRRTGSQTNRDGDWGRDTGATNKREGKLRGGGEIDGALPSRGRRDTNPFVGEGKESRN